MSFQIAGSSSFQFAVPFSGFNSDYLVAIFNLARPVLVSIFKIIKDSAVLTFFDRSQSLYLKFEQMVNK